MKKLSMVKLSKKEMAHVDIQNPEIFLGGYVWQWPPIGDDPDVECGCNCLYANEGGSSIVANGEANKSSGLFSPREP